MTLITPTKHGLRLSQHGVVISELRTSPGPTHSVFDVLAATIAVLAPPGRAVSKIHCRARRKECFSERLLTSSPTNQEATSGRIGVLGFAGGGMIAPLRGLGVEAVIDSVDLDRAGYDLFRQHCPEWADGVNWQQADAVTWLREQPRNFGLLMDDLSVPQNGDVFKPAVSWDVLPKLMRSRLRPGGFGVFNLLPAPGGTWNSDVKGIVSVFKTARIIDLDDFENHILITGETLPTARELGSQLRQSLRHLHSRQAGRIQVRTLN